MLRQEFRQTFDPRRDRARVEIDELYLQRCLAAGRLGLVQESGLGFAGASPESPGGKAYMRRLCRPKYLKRSVRRSCIRLGTSTELK